jgi:hypothetical protein
VEHRASANPSVAAGRAARFGRWTTAVPTTDEVGQFVRRFREQPGEHPGAHLARWVEGQSEALGDVLAVQQRLHATHQRRSPPDRRVPSEVERWAWDHAERHGLELRYTHDANPELADLGLIVRAQRAGDVVLSRPVFLRERAEVTWDYVPSSEWFSF